MGLRHFIYFCCGCHIPLTLKKRTIEFDTFIPPTQPGKQEWLYNTHVVTKKSIFSWTTLSQAWRCAEQSVGNRTPVTDPFKTNPPSLTSCRRIRSTTHPATPYPTKRRLCLGHAPQWCVFHTITLCGWGTSHQVMMRILHPSTYSEHNAKR